MTQNFDFQELDLKGAFLIKPFFSTDDRGLFLKDYHADTFLQHGIEHTPKEVFYAESKRGVLRGLHFQLSRQQAKLVRCVSGHVYDAIVDLRPDSETYGKWLGFDLSGENMLCLYVPRFFGHGYLALEKSTVSYQCSEMFYSPGDSGIKWDDAQIGITWPLDAVGGCEGLVISEKDRNLMSFAQYDLFVRGAANPENGEH